MKSIALNRHHERRIKRRVQDYYGGAHRDEPRRIGQMARSRALCSCWMSGNPRKYLKEITFQERRRIESLESSYLSD